MKRWILAAALLAACSNVSTHYDFDTKTDFGKLKTYRWLPPPKEGGTVATSPLIRQRIQSAVDRELAAKGYRPAEGEVDFLVAVHTGAKQRVQVTDWGYRYGYGYYGWGGGRMDVYQYEEGTMILDIVDAGAKKLVWRGTAIAALSPQPTPEQTTKLIDEAVNKLLRDFPPPPR